MGSLAPSLALALLFLVGFAFGLRLIDHRYAPPAIIFEKTQADPARPEPVWGLSEALRFLAGIPTVHAAGIDYGTYSGKLVGKAPSLTLAPGETRIVDLQFKNTGKANWSNAGRSYVSAYTIKPRYHASVFRSSDWTSARQTARLLTPTVRPGETGTLRVTLTAPKKPGTYSDSFQLAAEDTSWMWSAWTPVTVKVSASAIPASTPPSAVAAPASVAVDPAPAPLQGSLSYRSAERIEAPGGLQMTARFSFRNTGETEWNRHGLRIVSFKAPEGGDAELSDPSWASPELPVIVDRSVRPGQSTDIYFSFTTPRKKGEYLLKLEFVSDGAALASGPIELAITSTMDDEAEPPPTEIAPQETPYVPEVTPSGEPLIRVGLYTTDHQEEIGSSGTFDARTVEGVVLKSFAANSRVRFWYDAPTRAYRVVGAGADLSSAAPIRFVQTGSAEVFILWSFENRPKWNLTLNDNMFRGALELRKNDRNEYVWLIDELPIELYLRGMAETSNASPLEFQKALAVAARSYAYWHYSNPGKHWHFTVDATYDQVYRGYGAEIRLPKWVSAIASTRGQVVTHDGAKVVTPYYTWSDGRTRAWTEVWGGKHKPWLVSVPAPYDAAAGRTLFGHGVGMSAWDAIGRANDGAAYDTILRHYYTGTGLVNAY